MDSKTDYFASVRASKDFEKAIDMIPYAKLLGIRFQENEEEGLLFHLPFHEKNIGNKRLPAIHGGHRWLYGKRGYHSPDVDHGVGRYAKSGRF